MWIIVCDHLLLYLIYNTYLSSYINLGKVCIHVILVVFNTFVLCTLTAHLKESIRPLETIECSQQSINNAFDLIAFQYYC